MDGVAAEQNGNLSSGNFFNRTIFQLALILHFLGCAICCFTVIETINRSNASEQEAQLKFEQNQGNFEKERYNNQPCTKQCGYN